MATIPQKELRNHVGQVLRRAEAGERFTITVSRRPVAELGPVPTYNVKDFQIIADNVDLREP
jgi:prevent-host-death family protein